MNMARRDTPPPGPPRPEPPGRPPGVVDLGDLESQARYHRDRLALYRARMQGPRPTSMVRLLELERAASAADDRLRTARRLADR